MLLAISGASRMESLYYGTKLDDSDERHRLIVIKMLK